MLSYHNDPAIKQKYIARFAEHRGADEVIQGIGFDNGRGCLIGCTLDHYDHSRFPIELGWPEWMARWADKVFEGLPKSEAAQFGSDLLEAVPVGVDLDPVKHTLAIARLERCIARLVDNDEPYAVKVREAINIVIVYHENPAARSAVRSAGTTCSRCPPTSRRCRVRP